jgi:putative endonuclease
MSGAAAEELAARYLGAHGLKLIERNYRCRFGEIDLIMRDARTLVFVEVRMRASDAFGGAAASITPAKQAKLIQAARHYLAQSGTSEACRFDAVLLRDARDVHGIEWIKDAFSAD